MARVVVVVEGGSVKEVRRDGDVEVVPGDRDLGLTDSGCSCGLGGGRLMFAKGEKVTNGRTCCRVVTRHRDGTVTLRATFPVVDGREAPECGFLGYVYRRQPTEGLEAMR